ncbi:septation protein A [Niveispirillum sp. SYP-B3756]|uniref:septation protein A n=1 Tax=Niveispirillum sp. SYP-B3756 TaxID=2662178 RepID=UPI00129156E9|nr:septation protein A [Niveispirillum sp. SYP-B3756]MQP65114.1 septation protein A [Niveispirillum sp. SYP-B3756]
MNPLLRLLLEAGPLGLFFLFNAKAGLMVGTGVFMAAITVALIVNWLLERRLPVMPLVGCVFVLVFGGLTLWLDNDLFIKIKPTVVNLLLSVTLFVGLFLKRNLLKVVLGAALELKEEGWRILTVRWAWFFLFLAVANEIVWRSFDTDTWVNFKVFGIMPISILFSMLQVPVIMKHQKQDSDVKTPAP